MFSRKEAPEEAKQEISPLAARALTPDTPRMANPMAAPAPRRSIDIPSAGRSDRSPSSEERRLTVGKGLSLSGEIAACDTLVVEGKVEAKLTDGKLLEITESGQFRGSVEIENADIAGRYDGELTVHGRLTVRGTGRISGLIKYGELEVINGGQIIGELQTVSSKDSQGGTHKVGKKFRDPSKFAALMEEDEKAMIEQSSFKVAQG